MGLYDKKEGKCFGCGTAIPARSKRCRSCHIKYKAAVEKALQLRFEKKHLRKRRKKDPNYQLPTPYYHTGYFKSTQPGNIRDKIRNRDGYRCQRCGALRSTTVHHIDYDKRNDRERNLITLCSGCNTSVNYNRGYWTMYFQTIMKATGNQPNNLGDMRVQIDFNTSKVR
jgi:5-methylcytosine-specific restriction endonuclease McrA